MRGGVSRPRYVVTLYQLLNCKSDGCVKVDKFFMDDEGNTFGYDEYMKSKRDLSIVVTSSEFHTRVGSLLSKPSIAGSVKNIPPSKEIRDRTITRVSFAPLGKLDSDVYKRIVAVKDALISGKAEGYSPASYRAFLLASQLESDLGTGDKGSLNSLFCSDAWQDRDMTTTVAYSLLQSLYRDLSSGDITSRSAKECELNVHRFMSLTRVKKPASALPARYDDLTFRATPETLKPICSSQTGDGPRPIYSETHKRILMDAHQSLRDLYDRHLEACIELLRPILFFGTRGGYASPPSIRLDEEFRKHPRGSQAALEEKIAEARAFLSEHYFRVESVYQTALKSLGNLAIGNYATSGVRKGKKIDRLNEIAMKLKENDDDEEEKNTTSPKQDTRSIYELSTDTTSSTWMKGKVNQGDLDVPADTTNTIVYSSIKSGDTIVKVNSRLNGVPQTPSFFSLTNWISFLDSRLPQPVYNPNFGTQTVVTPSDVTIHTARITK